MLALALEQKCYFELKEPALFNGYRICKHNLLSMLVGMKDNEQEIEFLNIKVQAGKLYIQKKNGEFKVKNVSVVSDLKKIKSLTVYKNRMNAIKTAIDDTQKPYCPWCNPDKSKLKPHSKPRKCPICMDIEEFILNNSTLTKKQLNEKIVKILRNASGLEFTVLARKNKVQELLRDVKVSAKEKTELKVLVERAFS